MYKYMHLIIISENCHKFQRKWERAYGMIWKRGKTGLQIRAL